MKFRALIFNLLPIKRNKIVFYSESGQYADGPRYLLEKMQHLGLPYDYVWVSMKKCPGTRLNIRSCVGKYRVFYELATARIIIANGRLTPYWKRGFTKKKGQSYYQTLHVGGTGVQKMGADVHEPVISTLRNIKQDTLKTDYLVVGSQWQAMNYTSAFYTWKEPSRWGTPQNDLLLHPGEISDTVRLALGLGKGRKLVLYAPAARRWKGVTHFRVLDGGKILSALKRRFGGDWLMLIRIPPSLSKQRKRMLMPSNISGISLDVSEYPDTTELLATADILISDYATCAFDFLLTRKPAFLYTPDADEYEKHCGLYNPLPEVPLSCSYVPENLVRAILNFDYKKYTEKISLFLKQKGNLDDGNACDRIVENIKKNVERELVPTSGARRNTIKIFLKEIWNKVYHTERLDNEYSIRRVLGIKYASLKREIGRSKLPIEDIPIRGNKIVFRPVLRAYTDSPKYIVEELLKLQPAYDLVWIIEKGDIDFLKTIHTYPKELKLVVAGTPEAWYELLSAKVWVYSFDRTKDWVDGVDKRDGQIYIQLWHGSYFNFKKDVLTPPQKRLRQRSEGDSIDYAVVGGNYEETDVLKPLFRYTPRGKTKILKIGHPKNDIFFKDVAKKIKQKVYTTLSVEEGKKVVLYAPTFRDNGAFNWTDLNYKLVKDAFEKKFNGKWIIATRMHFQMFTARRKLDAGCDYVVNASEYVDMQELLVAADALISDYSSCIADFILTEKPLFLYTPDIKEYDTEIRGLLHPLSMLPCDAATDNVELSVLIDEFDPNVYKKKVKKFLTKVGCVECGDATQKLVNVICRDAPLGKFNENRGGA